DSAVALARILAGKGLLDAADLARVEAEAPENRVRLLAGLLEKKGVLTRAELASLTAPPQLPVVLAAYQGPAAPQPPAAPAKEGATTQAAPPVITQNKFPVTVYGTLLLNAFSNTSLTNIQDVPLFNAKQGSDPLGNDKSFGMTARQSRFGMRYEGPQVAGAQTSGAFEFDLLGGKAAFGNGINMDLFRF